MPLHPSWDWNATKFSSFDNFTSIASGASNTSEDSVASGTSSDVADYDGGGWLYCAYNKRLVQQDRAMVSLPNAITGRKEQMPSQYGVR